MLCGSQCEEKIITRHLFDREVVRACEATCYLMCPKGCFQTRQIILFHDVQPKRTLALKRHKCQESI